MPVSIGRISADQAAALRPQLVILLQANVDDGASIGFLPPLSAGEAGAYWQGVEEAVRSPYRILLVAQQDEQVVGSVQLDLVAKPNGAHRAEVMKLMVHPTQRRQGIARALMLALEAQARAANRTTLVLDTRQGDPSEQLYRSLGYTCIGVIPQYCISANGNLDGSAFYYKLV
jgi:ribosomal protein S18 acetylase RimI-like enzyme